MRGVGVGLLVALLLLTGCTPYPKGATPATAQAGAPEPGRTTAQPPGTAAPVPPSTVTPVPVLSSAPAPTGCSPNQERIRRNLAAAVQAKRPLRGVMVGSAVEQMIGPEEFTQQVGVASSLATIERQVERGQWAFVGSPGKMALVVQTGGTDKEHVLGYLAFRFDPGQLTPAAPVAALGVLFQGELSAKRVMAYHGSVVIPAAGADEITAWWGAVKLDRLLSTGWDDCLVQTVEAYDDGHVYWIDLPMIDLHNGAMLGFTDGKLVTYSSKSGTYGSQWYDVPGVEALVTSDAGKAAAPEPPLRPLAFTDPDHGWAAAGNQLYRTADGGRHWTVAAALPDALWSLAFAGAEGWALTADHGLLHSADGGKTWARAETPAPLGTIRSIAVRSPTGGRSHHGPIALPLARCGAHLAPAADPLPAELVRPGVVSFGQAGLGPVRG